MRRLPSCFTASLFWLAGVAACGGPGAAGAGSGQRWAEAQPPPTWMTDEGRLTAWRDLAGWYIDNGFPEEALRMVERILQEGQRTPTTMVIQAQAMAATGMPSEAERVLAEVVSRQPRFAQAWYVLGNVRADLEEVEPAMEAYRRALRLDPDHSKAGNNLGFLLMAMDLCGEAVRVLERVVSKDSTHPLHRSNLAHALVCDGQAQRAIDLFRTLHSEDEARYNLGVAYERWDKVTAAKLQYEQVIKINPDHELAKDALARLAHPSSPAPGDLP